MPAYKALEDYRWHGTARYRVGDDGSAWSRGVKIGNRWTLAPDWIAMKPSVHHDGYRYVTLYRNGKPRSCKVSVLVCALFHGPKPEATEGRIECLHKNGIRHDDRADNLEWGSTRENAKDRAAHGRTASGERNGFAKLTDAQVAEIRSLSGKLSQEKIGRRFGVSQVHVGRILRGDLRK